MENTEAAVRNTEDRVKWPIILLVEVPKGENKKPMERHSSCESILWVWFSFLW